MAFLLPLISWSSTRKRVPRQTVHRSFLRRSFLSVRGSASVTQSTTNRSNDDEIDKIFTEAKCCVALEISSRKDHLQDFQEFSRELQCMYGLHEDHRCLCNPGERVARSIRVNYQPVFPTIRALERTAGNLPLMSSWNLRTGTNTTSSTRRSGVCACEPSTNVVETTTTTVGKQVVWWSRDGPCPRPSSSRNARIS